MGKVFNPDFSDFLISLEKSNVRYILIGGYAVIYHGYNRTTGDLDIWVEPTSENYTCLTKAFSDFGMSFFDVTREKFLDLSEFDVFTFGKPPVCIEILTAVKGLDFESTYTHSELVKYDGIQVRMIDIRDLIATKKAVHRPKDLDDLEHLKSD
jgi:predicted nucleotidyltransferase